MNYFELYHHGIKGQQWGKRNGPPYPLGYVELLKGGYLSDKQKKSIKKVTNKNGDIVVKKGTTLSRVTGSKYETEGSKYMSFLDEDKKQYKTDFIHYMDSEHGYEDIYKAEKDLKIASYEKTLSTILDNIGDKKVSDVMSEQDLTWEKKTNSGYMAKEALNKVKNKTLKDFYGDIKEPKYSKNDPIGYQEQVDLANNYKRIGERILNKQLYGNEKLKNSTIDQLKKQGYDSMIDVEDAFGYSTLPIVTFTDKIKKIDQKQIW